MMEWMIQRLTSQEDLQSYDAWVQSHPRGSLWQSPEWKRYQEALGREVRIYALLEGTQILASALVIIDWTVFGYSTWDIPRGPIGERREGLLMTIMNEAKREHCLSLYLSPLKA
jgi:lipid II:glycine glycyltransferase (peptidoglycan interpeptide bridge formation enzyme)